MSEDVYARLAARYDRMIRENPERDAFFRDLFARRSVRSLLDCACGTGRDLIAFHRMGLTVQGSDLSEAMLAQARSNLAKAGIEIPLQRIDFRELAAQFERRFDAVVCLSNSINELLDDAEVLRALGAMRAVLRPGGLVVVDQGQTDASVRQRPLYEPVVKDRDLTRVFVMEYDNDLITVHVLDFLHTGEEMGFDETTVRLRIRLRDDWQRLFSEAGFSTVDLYGSWKGAKYDNETAERLIAVATK